MAWPLFLGCFAAFLLTGSREPPWNDARPIHEVAESLVYGRGVAVETRWPYEAPRGRDRKLYSAAPILPSLVHVPGVIVHHAAVKLAGPAAWQPGRVLTSHLGPAACGALVCVLFFGICRRLGIAPLPSALGTVALGFGTAVWVYARSPFSEIAQMACFTGFFGQLLRFAATPDRRAATGLGVWAGLLINTKLALALALPGAVLFLGMHRLPWRPLAAAIPGLLGGLAITLVYNHLRWGSPFATGYRLADANPFREHLAVGLWGMWLSPGKSVFLYCPPLLLSIAALPRVWRERRAPLVALALTAGPVVLLHAALPWWSGDWAWGPRYLVFAVPVLLLPACLLLHALAQQGRRGALVACGALALAGVGVQALGNALYWDHFIRIAQAARGAWLGTPNRAGSLPPSRGLACDPCFEDLHPIAWLPPFQPIRGHLWLARHVALGHDAATAEADAPWRRHTSLRLDIREPYSRTRLDWWFLELRPAFPLFAWTVIVLLAAGATAGFVCWARRLR